MSREKLMKMLSEQAGENINFTDEERERIQNSFEAYVEELYTLEAAADSSYGPDAEKKLLDKVHLEEEKSEIAGGIMTAKRRTISALFIEALLHLVERKRRDRSRGHEGKLQNFLQIIDRRFFSRSPNIINNLPTREHLLLAAKVTRIPEAQAWLGDRLVNELAATLHPTKNNEADPLIEELRNQSVPQILDIIHLLHTVTAKARAIGLIGAELRAQQLIHDIDRIYSIPFVHYAAQSALRKIDQESVARTQPLVTRSGARFGRSTESLAETDMVEHQALIRQVLPDDPMENNEKLLAIAADALGIFTHTNLPQKFGFYHKESLPESRGASIVSIRKALHYLQQWGDRADPNRVLDFLQKEVFEPTYGEKAFENWHTVGIELSPQEWKDHFSMLDLNTLIQKYKKDIQYEFMCEKQKVFVEKIKEALGKIPPSIVENLVKNEHALIQDADLEKNLSIAFEAALRITHIMSTAQRAKSVFAEGEISEEFDHLYEEFNNNKGKYATMRERADERYRSAVAQLVEDSGIDLTRQVALEKKVVQNFNAIRERLIPELQKLEREQLDHLVPIHFQDYTEIANDPKLHPFSKGRDEDIPLLLQHLHAPNLRKAIEEDLGCRLADIPLRSQIHLLHFLQTKNSATFERLRGILKTYPEQAILNSFLACADDVEFGNTILDLAEDADMQVVFTQYNEFIKNAEQMASKIAELSDELDQQQLYKAFLYRGKHLLEEAKNALAAKSGREKQTVIAELISGLAHENELQSAMRASAVSLSTALQEKDVDLRRYEKLQKQTVTSFDAFHLGTALLQGFHARGLLAPVPEIHWRVDRTAEEYNRRFGFDVKQFLAHFARDGKQQLLLEFGPGNGTYKKDRGQSVAGYIDLALCDKLYYPLNKLIGNILDFEKLQPINDEEKGLICDFLYRILVIKEGQTAFDHFEYDQDVLEALKQNPQQLIHHLIRKAPLLKTVDCVPQTISTRDSTGNVIYPYKLAKPQTENFARICEALATNLQTYFVAPGETINIYDHIPAYPAGTIVSDFKDVKNLKDKQLDVALGVRSTVYLRGQDYIEFMGNVANKLNTNGIYVDDNVRDNDGWYYRIAELLEVQKNTDNDIYIITGKGFEGEDFNQNEAVPLAVVLTKDEEKLQYLKEHLEPGHELKKLDEVANDNNYLSQLDATGNVLGKVTEQRARLAA